MDGLKRLIKWSWAGFVIVAACVGTYADFLEVRASSSSDLPEISVMITTGLYYLSVIGIPLGVGYLVFQWGRIWIDLRRDGPSVRRFQAMSESIKTCRVLLALYAGRTRGLENEYEDLMRRTDVSALVTSVSSRLGELKIPTDALEQFTGLERTRQTLTYLSFMERLAREGDIWTARRTDLGKMLVSFTDSYQPEE